MRSRHSSSLVASVAACLALAPAAAAQVVAPPAPAAADLAPHIRRELRGAWVASVSNIDWPSRRDLTTPEQQAELRAILDRAVALNLNAVILQVRPAADALYESPLEPWSEYLTGEQGRPPEPFYDPLRFAVDEAHARGLELHAWFNPYRARHPSARRPNASTHISATHPELVRTYGAHQWMDPGEPAVMERTLDVMLDVVRRYDVDGIHIDDYFYPYPELAPDSTPIPFPDSASYARYVRGGGALDRNDWRRHNVDTLVYEIYRRTKAVKPWVRVGISPFGIWRPGTPPSIQGFDAYDRLYADARRWLREGWVDYFTPQLYWPIGQTAQSYPVLLDWWLGENVRARHVWPGHFTSRAMGPTWPPGELREQIRITRETGASGDVHFSMRALMPPAGAGRGAASGAAADTAAARPASVGEQLLAGPYAEPALVPVSPWLARGRPARPTVSVTVEGGESVAQLAPGDTTGVRWWTVQALTDGRWRTWVLPGVERRVVLGAVRPTRVVVMAVDRYGTQSEAVEVR